MSLHTAPGRRPHPALNRCYKVNVESKEAILKSLREDEQRLRELAELVAPNLRNRVETLLSSVRSRIAVLELRQGASAADNAAGVRKEARTGVEIVVCIRGNGR